MYKRSISDLVCEMEYNLHSVTGVIPVAAAATPQFITYLHNITDLLMLRRRDMFVVC
jgi:hypothetical protein